MSAGGATSSSRGAEPGPNLFGLLHVACGLRQASRGEGAFEGVSFRLVEKVIHSQGIEGGQEAVRLHGAIRHLCIDDRAADNGFELFPAARTGMWVTLAVCWMFSAFAVAAIMRCYGHPM